MSNSPLISPVRAALFAQLVAAMAASHDRDNARPPTTAEGIHDVEEAWSFVQINVEEGDSYVAMLQNLASTVGAINRLADVLMASLTYEQINQAILENQP